MTGQTQRALRRNDAVSRALWLALSTGALFVLDRAFLRLPCWSLLLVCAPVAWPIWYGHREYALFRRRAVLAGLFRDDSQVRRWFWSDRIGGMWQAAAALFWATLLLAFGALLPPERWGVLAADVLALALFIRPVSRRLRAQVRGGRAGLVARRWPLSVLNLTLLTLGFLILDFLAVGAPDTRGMTWNLVAENAFSEVSAGAGCPLAGWLAGTLAVADRLTWHAFEVLTPSLPHPELRLAAWLGFLLQVGVLSYAFTRFQLGVVALVERPAPPLTALIGDDRFSKAFFLTILVLALPCLYATLAFRDFDPAGLATGARKVIAWANPCRLDPRSADTLKSGLAAEIESARAAAKERADERIDGALDLLFGEIEHGVDGYLDWYFSVLGEYERLAALAAGQFAEQMNRELEQRLFAGSDFEERLAHASREIADGSIAQMSTLATRLSSAVRSDVKTDPCRLEIVKLSALGNLDRDVKRAAAAAGGGALVGTAATKLLAEKTAVAVAGKVASKKAFQVAANLPAKVAAKKGGSILLSAAGGAAICSPLGPVAALCGVGAGVASWLIFDQTLIKIDEVRFRAEMRRELLESALAQKAVLADELRSMHYAAIDDMALGIRKSVDGAFIPIRDGL